MADNSGFSTVEDSLNELVIIRDAAPDNGVELMIQDVVNNTTTTIQDRPSSNIDVHDLFEDDLFLIQDAPDIEPAVAEVFSQEQIINLVDAGPVFRGPAGQQGLQGQDGPVGPSLYDLWLGAGHSGSLDDFLATLKGESGLGAKSFTFVQNQLSAVWSITHNLNKIPTIILIDSAGEVFDADIQYLNLNTLVVTIIAPTLGTAYLQ